ncbi:MAG: hypothetical protein ACRD0X_08620 [Thermoanaerobaculia bacterium]
MSEQHSAFEARLELFATVALLGVTAVVKTLQSRDSTASAPEALVQLRAVRGQVQTALDSLDAYLAGEPEPTIDLGGLRGKLVTILRTLDQWPIGEAGRPT